MNTHIYSSNNEGGLLKFIGPFRLQTADQSIAGVRLPRVILYGNTTPAGTVNTFGTQILIEPASPLPNQDPDLEPNGNEDFS
ncbi:MAG TPA: hypothetical protein PLD25_14135 [Chloroflexota bacterium]|nr:hypothetical protein [Chloroflexota bacterium]HUM68229.1 hypothetical protein [Chloroflexota bacterium]